MADFGMMLLSDRVDSFIEAAEKNGFTTNKVSKSRIELIHPKMHSFVDMNERYLSLCSDKYETDDDILRRVYFENNYDNPGLFAMYRLSKEVILVVISTFIETLKGFLENYDMDLIYKQAEKFFQDNYHNDIGNPKLITSDQIKLDPVMYSNREINLDDTECFNALVLQSVEIGQLYGVWIRAYARHCIC